MAKGFEFHHDGTSDICEFNGQLKVDDPADAKALQIEGGANDVAINVESRKYGLKVENSASAGSGYTIKAINAGTAEGILIDQNGNGKALNIDSEATTEPAIQIDHNLNNDQNSLKILHNGSNAFFIIRNTDLNDNVVMKLGNSHLWVDATGDLRISATYPSADTSGTVVGTQA